jgi:hypothetical protein
VLPALLVEVKGLRAAMEQMAGAGPRVQLFVGRLQLQEDGIAGMVRRLDTVRDTLASARRELEAQERQKMTRSRDAGGRAGEEAAACSRA